jgi:hypothetical protein
MSEWHFHTRHYHLFKFTAYNYIIQLKTNKGMVRSDMSKPALIFFFFTARVHTTKSIDKILAANTDCKYF